MTDSTKRTNIEVSLAEAGREGECVKIAFSGAPDQVLSLTPQQARVLASELIQTVYKAEVKTSLQRNQRQVAPAAERVVQGGFPGTRVVGAQ